MALVRLNGQIISITGTCGGDVWKRDASGQHVIGKQRHVKKTRSIAQTSQNDWYNMLKREESHGGPPAPDEPEPESPTTMLIYQLDYITFTRQRSLTQPDSINVNENPDHNAEAGVWVLDYWYLFKQIPGLTPDLVVAMLLKVWYQYMFTWGVIPGEALALAKADIIAWAELAIQKGVMVGYWLRFLGYTALIICAVVHDFYSKHNVSHNFSPGESVARLNGNSYWARLVGRPGPHTFDFAIGPLLLPPPFVQHYDPVREGGWSYRYAWTGLIQSIVHRPAWWDTFTWKDIDITGRGEAYPISPGIYRSAMTATDIHYYNVPIGWQYSGDPFAFVNEIFDVG